MKILGNRVLLKPLAAKTVSDGGIHYAMAFRDDQSQFEVLAVGPKVPDEVKPGCRVLAFLYRDHTALPDGSRIVDAKELLAVWGK